MAVAARAQLNRTMLLNCQAFSQRYARAPEEVVYVAIAVDQM